MSANRIAETLTWLGGGEWREVGERHERSMHVTAGVVVLFGAVLAWLVSTLAITEATHVKGHEELPSGGHENCPVVAMRSAHSRPPDVPPA